MDRLLNALKLQSAAQDAAQGQPRFGVVADRFGVSWMVVVEA